MKDFGGGPRKTALWVCGWLAVSIGLAGCGHSDPNKVQGYVEGEYVYVASSLPGTLDALSVTRGMRVKAGDRLFVLESTPEQTALDEAKRHVAQAVANLEDAKKSKRPSEIDSVEAQLRQTQAALALSEKELARQEKLALTQANSIQDLDRARSTRDQDAQHVAQFGADLKTARLGSRKDQIVAADENVKAQEAILARAEWDLAQKRQDAPKGGLIFDTLYRQGEWVAGGRPVVVLLPPENIKVRAFVPETRVGAIQPGDAVRVSVDGVNGSFTGKVSYISQQAEYTPPVIYSTESRNKLAFMIEAVFDPETSAKLHPGQPVDLWIGR